MTNQTPPQEVQLQIELDEVTAQGIYTNLAVISHNETEFVLDFIFVQPQQPKAKVRARIISSPNHTKRFLEALIENIKKYEQKFGTIKPAAVPDEKQKFVH